MLYGVLFWARGGLGKVWRAPGEVPGGWFSKTFKKNFQKKIEFFNIVTPIKPLSGRPKCELVALFHANLSGLHDGGDHFSITGIFPKTFSLGHFQFRAPGHSDLRAVQTVNSGPEQKNTEIFERHLGLLSQGILNNVLKEYKL